MTVVGTGLRPARRLGGARGRSLLWEGRELALPGDDRPVAYFAKRAIDVVVTVVLLIVLGAVMVLLAVAVRLDSEGPALFVQERWGARRRRGPDGVVWEARVFRCVKFRTMAHGADTAVHVRHVHAFVTGELGAQACAVDFKLAGDPRITGLGRLLRRTSLDELPQLLNVLRGEMSLVGPRPVPVYEVEGYPGDWCLGRLGALPGLTGVWQVHGRSRATFEEMIEMDLDYVRSPSLLRDLGLLCLTVPSVLSRRGAR